MIYDDWCNDWLNYVYIKGTITRTGDQDLVWANIEQTVPLIENVNDFRVLNGIKTGLVGNAPFIGPDIRNFSKDQRIENVMTPSLYVRLNEELKKVNFSSIEDNFLKLPLVVTLPEKLSWKQWIIKGIQRLDEVDYRIYDVEKTNFAAKVFSQKYGVDKIYTLATTDRTPFVISKSVNEAVFVTKFDLSKATDIVELDPKTFEPKYTPSNPVPNYSVKRLVDLICNQVGWGSGTIKGKMIEITLRLFDKHFKGVALPTEEGENIFKNVTLKPKTDETILFNYNGT